MRLNCHHFKVCINLKRHRFSVRECGSFCHSPLRFAKKFFVCFCMFLILFMSFGFSSFFSALLYYIGLWDGIFSGLLIYY